MRCFGDGDPLYERYHDEEWGRPVADERRVFERLSLEGFQSGLSWITILRKREGFRTVFHRFEPHSVAAMDEEDVDRLMADAGIVRNRAKIEATISNARTLVALHASGVKLADLIWGYVESVEKAPTVELGALPSSTPAAASFSKELKKAGFRFIGPTTAYAAMQAIGVVNDHLATCHVRDEVERERERFLEGRRAD